MQLSFYLLLERVSDVDLFAEQPPVEDDGMSFATAAPAKGTPGLSEYGESFAVRAKLPSQSPLGRMIFMLRLEPLHGWNFFCRTSCHAGRTTHETSGSANADGAAAASHRTRAVHCRSGDVCHGRHPGALAAGDWLCAVRRQLQHRTGKLAWNRLWLPSFCA